MKLLLVLIFIASAQSAPQHNFANEFRAGLVKIPEGCTFLSQSQETVNGLIKGEYTYEDPIGSRITVTYQVNQDGSDYVERRKIIKGYGSDGSGFGNLLTADEVVKQVTTELRPTIIQIISITVTQSNVDLNNYDNLVETIIKQLEPVVTLSVNSALATSPHGHLNANELITRIIKELRPFVSEALREEIENQKPKVSEEDIVRIVSKQLEETIIRVIKATVAGSSDSDLLKNQEKLVQTIVLQLRPVVLQAVQRALTAQNVNGFNANSLADRIVTELTSFVRRGVGAQILELQQQQQANAGKIVSSVIRDLRPIIIRIIKESVRSYNGDLSQYGNLVETIMTQLRPVVLAEVRRALSSSSYKGLNAEDLTNKITIQLRAFVEEGVQEQVRLLQQELEGCADKVVESVITNLRPIIIRIIRQTVRSSNADVTQYDNLVQIIVTQLRPVVLNEVTKALATSSKCGKLDARDVTERIIAKITPFVQEGVEEQIREIERENQITPDQIVDKVIIQLQPITIKVIKQAVTSSTTNIEDEEALVQTIVGQLRPVVFAQVTAAIQANNANYNAQEISDKIVVRLIPFVREGVKKEVQIQQQNNQGSLVKDIIDKLDPFIKTTIKDALNSNTVTVLDASQKQQAMAGVLAKLRGIIKQAVITVMTRLQASGTAYTLSDEAIIAQVNVEIKNGLLLKLLQDEISGLLGANTPLPPTDVLQGIMQNMLPEIRKIILIQISQWRQTNPETPQLSSSQQGQVISGVSGSLRGQIEFATNQLLEQSSKTIGNEVIVSAIIKQFQSQIISALQNNRVILQVFSNSNFATSDAYEVLLQRIIQAFRAIILEQIRIYRARVVVVVTTPQPTVAPAPSGNAISNIFGFGGANTVQVETPNYKYEYDHARSIQ